MQEYEKEIAKAFDGFAPDVFEVLASYRWPGNIRELQNFVRRAAALAEESMPIQTYHFPSQVTGGESLVQEILSSQTELSSAVEHLQRRMVEDALGECNGNRAQAAVRLGMHRPNLIRLMKRLGIQDSER